jgi:hypothetical protein
MSPGYLLPASCHDIHLHPGDPMSKTTVSPPAQRATSKTMTSSKQRPSGWSVVLQQKEDKNRVISYMLDIFAGSYAPWRAHAVIPLGYKPIQKNVSGQYHDDMLCEGTNIRCLANASRVLKRFPIRKRVRDAIGYTFWFILRGTFRSTFYFPRAHSLYTRRRSTTGRWCVNGLNIDVTRE